MHHLIMAMKRQAQQAAKAAKKIEFVAVNNPDSSTAAEYERLRFKASDLRSRARKLSARSATK